MILTLSKYHDFGKPQSFYIDLLKYCLLIRSYKMKRNYFALFQSLSVLFYFKSGRCLLIRINKTKLLRLLMLFSVKLGFLLIKTAANIFELFPSKQKIQNLQRTKLTGYLFTKGYVEHRGFGTQVIYKLICHPKQRTFDLEFIKEACLIISLCKASL